jgi:flagellar hook-associated protein 3 FlgL
MTNRISTAGFSYRALNQLIAAQSRLSQTQEQIASGKRVLTPADDPVAATRIQDLTRQISASQQYLTNNSAARSRLELEEQSLANVNTSLNRIRELLLQASNDTVDAGSRRMIRAEVEGRVAELLDLANTKDAQGEYLFAGLATLTQPYARAGGTVQYFGDQGQRLQQVSETQRVADSDSGFDVFGRIAEGNGTFVTSAVPTNTGAGWVSVGGVIDRAAWPGGTFMVQFTTSGTWQVVDSGLPTPNVVASGNFVDGNAITFAGVSVQVHGTPAAGDQFVVREAARTDLFTVLDGIVSMLGIDKSVPAGQAAYRERMEGSLAQLDQAMDHVLNVRSGVGVRLSTLDSAQATQEDAGVNFETLLSGLRDLDYAEAISRMNLQYLGLQAAQKSMASLSQLSLFDYL